LHHRLKGVKLSRVEFSRERERGKGVNRERGEKRKKAREGEEGEEGIGARER
jgi:hypothetical protein